MIKSPDNRKKFELGAGIVQLGTSQDAAGVSAGAQLALLVGLMENGSDSYVTGVGV